MREFEPHCEQPFCLLFQQVTFARCIVDDIAATLVMVCAVQIPGVAQATAGATRLAAISSKRSMPSQYSMHSFDMSQGPSETYLITISTRMHAAYPPCHLERSPFRKWRSFSS